MLGFWVDLQLTLTTVSSRYDYRPGPRLLGAIGGREGTDGSFLQENFFCGIPSTNIGKYTWNGLL